METLRQPKERRHPELTEFYMYLCEETPEYEKANQMIKDGRIINDNTVTALFNPLSFVVERGYLEMCELLLDCGAQPNHAGKTGLFPLYVAARRHRPDGLKIMKLLIDRGAKIDLQFVNGDTPLLAAVFHGYLDYVKFFLENGSSVEERNNGGLTALHLAVKECHIDIAKEVLKRGADVNGKPNPSAKKRIKSFRRNKDMAFTPLHMTYLNRRYEELPQSESMLQLLLNNGAQLNAQLDNGRTVLHLYAMNNCVAMATDLIKAGCDLNLISTENDEMKTALHKAIDGNHNSQHLDMIVLLCESGADLTIADSKGCTPLLAACKLPTKNHQRESILALIQHGSDLSVRDNNGMTALEIGKNHLCGNFSLVFREASANMLDLKNHSDANSLSSPLTLMQNCRAVIRVCLLPGKMHDRIDTLSVPFKIKNYLKMKHIGDLL